MELEPTLSFRNRAHALAHNRKVSITSKSTKFHSRSFPSPRLFPSRDRVPLELSGSTPPRLILPVCIPAEAAAEQASARARRILREIFGQNFVSAKRTLPQTRKSCVQQCCLLYS